MSEYIDLSAITKRLKEVVDRSRLTSRDFAMKAGIAICSKVTRKQIKSQEK